MKGSIVAGSVFLLAGCVGQASAQTPPARAEAGVSALADSGASDAGDARVLLAALAGTGRAAVGVFEGGPGRREPNLSDVPSAQANALANFARPGVSVRDLRDARPLQSRTIVRGDSFALAVARRVMLRWRAQFERCFHSTVGRSAPATRVTMSFTVLGSTSAQAPVADLQFAGTTEERLLACLRARMAEVRFPPLNSARSTAVQQVFTY